MSEELSFTFRENSDIYRLMGALRSEFHRVIRGRKVTNYVFESEKMYLLIVETEESVFLPHNDGAAVLLRRDEGSWRALISPQRVWSEESPFYRGEKSILAELKTFFTTKCKDMITVTSAWAIPHEKEKPRQSEVGDVTPFYSELSEKGTLARCPKCGAAEIIFPNERTCSNCGAEIVRETSYPEFNDMEEEAKAPPMVVQAGGVKVGRCIVCGMSIHQGEPLAHCPSCAGRAHRAHLLEYVHVKGECPSCHNRIVEKEFAEQASRQKGAGSAPSRRTHASARFPKHRGAK
jgi:DNA-directed RNA polymerase subunit RPC12/RpoP